MAAPTSVSRNSGRSVARGESFNKKPLIIVGVIVGAFAFGLYYAAQSRVPNKRSERSTKNRLETLNETAGFNRIDFLEGREDGLVNAIKPPEPPSTGDDDENKGRESDLADQLAMLLEKQQLDEFKRNKTMQNELMARQYSQAQQALEGTMSVPAFSNRQHTRELNNPEVIVNASGRVQQGAVNADNIRSQIESYLPQQEISSGATSSAETAAMAGLSSTDLSGVVANRDFVQGMYKNDFTLNERPKNPSSKFQVMTGTLIPGVMISAANSELPGDLVAQVTQNVYDSVTGRYLLIPQGSKLYGRYDSFAALGSERLMMVWDRLVMPDGETLTLGSIQGYDERGFSGAKDQVITHFFKTLANAFLLSVATGSAEAIVDSTDKSDSIIGDITASFGSTSADAVDAYLTQRLKIKPTFIIRAGFRFNILVNRDITFTEPFEFGYTRLEIQ